MCKKCKIRMRTADYFANNMTTDFSSNFTPCFINCSEIEHKHKPSCLFFQVIVVIIVAKNIEY